MKKVKLYQIDTFTHQLFSGNPAAVCILENGLPDALMQSIANENNLSETAFVVPIENGFEIRWFTPTVEVDLCGHATLASAFVLFNFIGYKESKIRFYSPKSGWISVCKDKNLYYLDFPVDNLRSITDLIQQIKQCVGIYPTEVYKGREDYMAVFENEDLIKNIQPNFVELSKLNARGLIVTAKGDLVDFVSRFFAPQSGINEDPVTGSAHCSLIPYWSKKLNKEKLIATQLSKRDGKLYCELNSDRCLIGGEAKLYLEGEILIED